MSNSRHCHAAERVDASLYGEALPALLERAAAAHTAHAAVDAPGEALRLSYAELDAAADALATQLVAHGAQTGRCVGIYMPRCADYVVALVATLKTGAAYLVIEQQYPPSMLASVLRNAAPCAVVTCPGDEAALQAASSSVPVLLASEARQSAVVGSARPVWRGKEKHRATSETTCYVVYSSGSTGEPKGISAQHRSPVASYLWRAELSGYGPGARVGCNVFFVWECLRPLLFGGTCVVIPDDVAFDSAALVAFLAQYGVTETLVTPSLADNTLAVCGPAAFKGSALQRFWLNGEAVTKRLAAKLLLALPDGARLFNTYSISECGEVAAREITAADVAGVLATPTASGTTIARPGSSMKMDSERYVVTVGKAAAFARVRVVDDDSFDEVESGELIVAGAGVGEGYVGRPDLTAERFVHDAAGTLWYRTGDTAELTEDGEIAVVGRRKHMVKIRGFSVVPSAVENIILRTIAAANCVVRAAASHEGSRGGRLVCYIVRAPPGDETGRFASWRIDSANGVSPDLHDALLSVLQPYSIPDIWIEIDEVPRMPPPLAKVDTKRLPPLPPLAVAALNASESDAAADETYVLAADTPPVSAVAGMMALALRLPRGAVRKSDSFFSIGGNSLAAARLLALLRKRFGADAVAPGDLFQAPSPHDLVARLLGGGGGADGADGVLDQPRSPLSDGDGGGSADAGRSPRSPRSPLLTATARRERAGTAGLTLAAPFVAGVPLAEIAADVHRYAVELRQLASNAAAAAASEARGVALAAAPRHVLLTGATGFVGGALLRALLAASEPHRFRVTCLVRAKSDAAAVARLGDVAGGAVTAVAGDLLRERFGLPAARYEALLADIDVVVHAAAHVNLLLPYGSLRDANVLGTFRVAAAVLRAAAMRDVRFVYVSSNGVKQPSDTKLYAEIDRTPRVLRDAIAALGDSAADDADGAADEDDVDPLPLTGYGQSKVAAEALVRIAATAVANSSWLSTCAVRLGNVGPPRDAPSDANPDDFTRAIFAAASQCGAMPAPFFVELTPRNIVCDALVRLCGKRAVRGVVHVANAARYDARLLAQSARPVDLATFIAAADSDGLSMLLTSPAATELLQPPRFACARAGVAMPDLTVEYLREAVGGAAADTTAVPGTLGGVRPLAGKLVLVLGASSGIGAAIAALLVRRGAKVAACARRHCAIDGALPIKCDVTKRGDIENAIATAERELDGELYSIVNSAGVMYYEYARTVDYESWLRTVETNCNGALFTAGAAIALLQKRKAPGHLVFITSDAGRAAFDGLAVYSGSKAFIESTVRAMRRELAPKNVRLTTIQPGNVATPLAAMALDPAALKEFGAPSGAKVLDPIDVARAVVYALEQPQHVAVNELLIEPTGEPI